MFIFLALFPSTESTLPLRDILWFLSPLLSCPRTRENHRGMEDVTFLQLGSWPYFALVIVFPFTYFDFNLITNKLLQKEATSGSVVSSVLQTKQAGVLYRFWNHKINTPSEFIQRLRNNSTNSVFPWCPNNGYRCILSKHDWENIYAFSVGFMSNIVIYFDVFMVAS